MKKKIFSIAALAVAMSTTCLADDVTPIDFTATGNYVLFTDDASLTEKKVDMSKNEDNPFGYYYFDKEVGVYTKFSQYTTSTGWRRKNNEYLYITDAGAVHPERAINPSIMFTAPSDGYYYFGVTYERDGYNNKIKNPLCLYLRYVTSTDGNLTCSNDAYLYHYVYGDKDAAKNNNGLGPFDLNCFVNLKKGDKISVEIGVKDNASNGNGQNTISRFVVASKVNETTAFSKEYMNAKGYEILDPHKIDLTGLEATVSEANSFKEEIGSNHGDYVNTYYQEGRYQTFITALNNAQDFINNENHIGDTQAQADDMKTNIETAMQALKDTRNGYQYTLTPGTKIALKVAGTDKYLVRKNKPENKDFYYAAFFTISEILKDFADGKASLYDFVWQFDVTTNEKGGYNLAIDGHYVTVDAYVSESASADASRLSFWTKEENGSTVGVRRESDMKYWTSTINWNSPYNKVGTQDIPVYNLEVCTAPAATPYDYLRSLSESDDNSTKMTLCKNAGITMDVVLTRTLSNSYWNTFCVPFDISAEQISSTFGGAQITEFTGVDGTTMNFTEARSIVAGKPYLIKPVNTVENPTFSGVKITVTEPEQTTNGGYGFKGTLQPTTLATDGTNLFVSTTGEVKKPSATGNTIKGFRAYIIVPETVGESAKLSILGEVTGIDSISNGNGSDNGIIYNLSGQRVDGNAKGIVVKNGKKVIMSK